MFPLFHVLKLLKIHNIYGIMDILCKEKFMKNKLFNVIFPIWFLIIFPTTWLIVLSGNFVIDSLVFLIALKILKVSNIKEMYKKCILKIWIVGFIADIIGSLVLLITQFLPFNGIFNDIVSAIALNPFNNVAGFLVVLFAFLVSTFLIYVINYKYSLKRVDISDKLKVKIAVILAVFTAPYFFFLPTNTALYNSKNYNEKILDEHIICEYVELDNI